MPISLTRKLAYLRKAFRTLDRLASFKDRFEGIADQVRDASEERHDMIHGFIIGQVEDRALMARFVPGIEKPKLIPIDSVSILKAAVRADRIQCLQFADEIANFLNT